ncbi:hypothetical protein LEMLEM_LOCUS20945 [Lemmus lemmus]
MHQVQFMLPIYSLEHGQAPSGWPHKGVPQFHRRLQCLSLSILSLQSSVSLQKKHPCLQQPGPAWIKDFHTSSADSMLPIWWSSGF